MLTEHRQRTETNLPFTIQQVEDVMFVDERRLVSLEYIFYQKDGEYRKIKHQKEDDFATDHKLGTDDYAKDCQSFQTNPLSAFKDPPVNFFCSDKDYLEEHGRVKP